MIPLRLEEVETLTEGRLEAAPGAREVTGVQVDSRRVAPGDLFVAVGRGAEFVEDALARGAAATLVPEEPFAAFAALGSAVRDRTSARVVGITGSTGKTSTKDILAALCAPAARTVANEANFNNEIGVPLTLCRLEPDTEVCILELAMRGFGQIADLCAIARPDIGLVTNVGPVHLELVGSLDGVRRAKSELIAALPPGGTAIVPREFPVEREDVEVVYLAEPEARHRERTHRRRRRQLQLHRASPGGERRRCARRPRRAGPAAPAAGGCRVLALARRGAAAGRRRAADQRRLQREPRLDASRAGAPGRRVRRPSPRRGAGRDGRARPRRPRLPPGDRRGGRAPGGRRLSLRSASSPAATSKARAASPSREWAPDAESAVAVVEEVVEPGDCVLVKASRSVGLERVAEALAAVSA